MRSISLAMAVIVTMVLAACTYTRTFQGGTVTVEERPDGTRILTVEGDHEEETLKFNITGKSKREVRRLIPFPLMDCESSSIATNPIAFEYHYSYKFDVFDIHGDFVETLTVETYEDFVAMMPLACSLAGYPVPSQADLDALAEDMLVFWIDPETDWHRFN